jgi:hypothetical protein
MACVKLSTQNRLRNTFVFQWSRRGKNSRSFFHDKQVYENQGYSLLTVYTKIQEQKYNYYMMQLYAAITARIGQSCFVVLSRVCARGFAPKSHFRQTRDNHRYRGASKLCCI